MPRLGRGNLAHRRSSSAASAQTGPEDHLHQCGLKTTVLDWCTSSPINTSTIVRRCPRFPLGRMVAHGTEVSGVRPTYLRTRAKDVMAMFGGPISSPGTISTGLALPSPRRMLSVGLTSITAETLTPTTLSLGRKRLSTASRHTLKSHLQGPACGSSPMANVRKRAGARMVSKFTPGAAI